MGDYSHR